MTGTTGGGDKVLSTLLGEDRIFEPADAFARQANAADPSARSAAEADPEGFWARSAKELEWLQPWERVLEWRAPHAKWFVGGKLNASINCVDRHAKGRRRSQAAIIWEGEPGDRRTLTFWDLYREVNKFANALRSLGVKKGDRVAIYMPMIPCRRSRHRSF